MSSLKADFFMNVRRGHRRSGRRVWSVAAVLACLAAPAHADQADWSFGFERGVPSELILHDASVTDDRRLVVSGRRSVFADFTNSQDKWHEFLHTGEAIRFDKGRTYAVRFAYRVVNSENPQVMFYSQLRSRAGRGDVQSDHWLWRMPTGWTGHINRLFRVPEDGGYYLMLGVRHNGAIVIDDLEIREVRSNPAAREVPVRTHPSLLAEPRARFDEIHAAQGLGDLLNDMLIVVLNEGAGAKARVRKDEIVRDLEPDFIDWNIFGEMAQEYGIRSSTGGCEYQEYYKFEGSDDPAVRERVWENRYRLFGNSGFVVTLENTFLADATWGQGGYFTCHNGRNWHQHFRRTLVNVAHRFAAITQDNIACSVFNRVRGCYCPGCQEGFREMLPERFERAELEAMGIDDPGTFSIQAYILQHGLLGDDAVRDAVVREYMKFQFISGLLRWADCVHEVKQIASRQGRNMPVGGNQINIWGTWPYAVAISQFCDFIEVEELVSVQDRVDRRPLQYKLGLASGHHAKPVWVRGPVDDATRPRTPILSTAYWTIHFAEGLANGGIREFSLGVNRPWTGDPDTKDYIDDPELYGLYIDFARWMREHRSLLTHRESAARVAVVYSLPNLMFRRYDALHTTDGDRLGRFERTTSLFEHEHIPHDVIVFGHPEIWDDAPTFERMQTHYDVIVLPGVDALTDEQVEVLRACAARGITLLADEEVVFDENLNRRPAPVELPVEPASGENLVRSGREASLVRLRAPRSVSVNLWRSCEGRSFDVHLLNYEADPRGDHIAPVGPIAVRVLLPEDAPAERCVLSRFDRPDEEIPFRREGRIVELVVPELEGYAIVSLTDEDAIERVRSEAEARREADREHVRRMARRFNLY